MPDLSTLKPGDVLGFSSCSCSGAVVNLATFGVPFWGLSHVGIVARWQGELLLFESTSLCGQPCVIRGNQVVGLQAHKIQRRVAKYNGKVWVYPLRNRLGEANDHGLGLLCQGYLGRSYDYIGAFRCRSTPFGWLERKLSGPNKQALFCSEFVANMLLSCGQFRTLDTEKWNPNNLCRALVKRGVTSKPQRLK